MDPTISSASSSSATDAVVNCECGLPSKVLTVRKNNHNHGRKFRRCGAFPAQVCNFFDWVYEDGPPMCCTCIHMEKKFTEFHNHIQILNEKANKIFGEKDELAKMYEDVLARVNELTTENTNLKAENIELAMENSALKAEKNELRMETSKLEANKRRTWTILAVLVVMLGVL